VGTQPLSEIKLKNRGNTKPDKPKGRKSHCSDTFILDASCLEDYKHKALSSKVLDPECSYTNRNTDVPKVCLIVLTL
jgi:hypothetical protein